MKKFSLQIFNIFFSVVAVLIVFNCDSPRKDISKNEDALVSVDELKQKHKEYLANNPFQAELLLSKKENID